MTKLNTPTSRREFLKKGLGVSSFATLFVLGNQKIAFGQALPTTALDENDPMAKAMGYHHDATKVDTTKFPKRAGPEGEKQFCHSCILFLQAGLKADGKDGEWGKCGLFQNGLVNSNGWCNSWALKPT